MSDAQNREGGNTPRKTAKRTPVTSEPTVRSDILAGSKTNGRPPRTLLETETTAPNRRAAKPKLTPAAKAAMDAVRKDITGAVDAGDTGRTSPAQTIEETGKPGKAAAKRAASPEKAETAKKTERTEKAAKAEKAEKAERSATRAARQAGKTAAQALHSGADTLVDAASETVQDAAAGILDDAAKDAKAAAMESTGVERAIPEDASATSGPAKAAASAIPEETKAPISAVQEAKADHAAAKETLKKLRAANEAATEAKAAATGIDAKTVTDTKFGTETNATPKTVILPTEQTKKPGFAPPQLAAAFLSEDGEALTAIPETHGPKHPFGLQVIAKAAASVPGTVSVRFTLPPMLEPHIHDGQLDIVLKHNEAVVEADAYLDWSQSDGKLDLHTRLVLKRGDVFEAILPMHTRAGMLPENGLLVYGEFLTGTVRTDLPLLHAAAHPQRQAEVRATLRLESGADAAEPLPLPEGGRFTLSLRAQAAYAACNLTVELSLPKGLLPVFIGGSPVFLASLDGRIITTRGGLWDGVYDPAGSVRFTFYDISPARALELSLPLAATAALEIPQEGLALAPMLRIGEREEAMEPVHLLPGDFQPGGADAKAPKRTNTRPIAFCPLTQPM